MILEQNIEVELGEYVSDDFGLIYRLSVSEIAKWFIEDERGE